MELELRLLELQRLQEQSPVLSFLRSHSLDMTGAFLITYFQDDSRRIDVDELHSRIGADLEALVLLDKAQVRYTPATLTTQWVDRGLLARRQHPRTRSEYFELTSSGAQVIAFLGQIDQPLAKATQSRLANLTQMLVSLEIETNPDKAKRIETLRRRREEIDREIERVESGQIDILPARQALENLQDIVDQAREVPSDFLRVRDEFDDINRTLRRDILESGQRQEETLTEVFMGIDHVQSSDAGQSFDAFYRMLLNEERHVAFDSAVQALDERKLLDQLSSEDAALLREYSYILQREAMPVREVMTTLSRNLRQFVQSRQFQQFKAMMEMISDIQRMGLYAAESIKPWTRIPTEIEFSTAIQQSVGALKLRYPEEERTDETVEILDMNDLDMDALNAHIRESEIDFVELRANINSVLAQATNDGSEVTVDIGRVFSEFPPTQGLASIVGMLFLGMRHGQALGEELELTWRGQTDGVLRTGRISNYEFEQTIGDMQ